MKSMREGAPQNQDHEVTSDLESTSELPILDAAGIEAFAQDEAAGAFLQASSPAVGQLAQPGGPAASTGDALLHDLQLASARALAPGAPVREAGLNPPARVSGHDTAASDGGETGEVAQLRRALHESEARAARYLEQLQSRQGRSGVVNAVYLELQARIDAREVAIGRLEREIELAHSRAVELQAELRARLGRAGELERALATKAAAMRTAQGKIEELEATAAETAALRALAAEREQALLRLQASHAELLARVTTAEALALQREAQLAEQLEALRALQSECNAGIARREELEADVRAAEDAIHRLEAELRNRSARLGELERARDERRMAPADEQHATTDVHLERQVREPMPDGTRRMLVRSDGGAEVVHVLGRKTSIGRTLDNDLQIEASFISRHHAVILAGPTSSVIEDLNSTNGVLVNGQRVTRQSLADGDEVVIGRTRFRFVVR